MTATLCVIASSGALSDLVGGVLQVKGGVLVECCSNEIASPSARARNNRPF